MKETTEYDRRARSIPTKECSDFQLGEKIRVIDWEIALLDRDIMELARQIHIMYAKKNKRKRYNTLLRHERNKRD